MSFVSKGEKKMHNKAKGASEGKGFVKKGERKMHNQAPGSKDAATEPVSEDAGMASDYSDGPTAKASQYDPASGKRAKSVADLRAAAKKLNESSGADGSPTGSEGGQDGKHSSSKNSTGYMKAGDSEMDKKSKKAPRSQAPQDADEMVDPLDEDQEDDEQTKEGMTPKGTSRKKAKSLNDLKDALKKLKKEVN